MQFYSLGKEWAHETIQPVDLCLKHIVAGAQRVSGIEFTHVPALSVHLPAGTKVWQYTSKEIRVQYHQETDLVTNCTELVPFKHKNLTELKVWE